MKVITVKQLVLGNAKAGYFVENCQLQFYRPGSKEHKKALARVTKHWKGKK